MSKHTLVRIWEYDGEMKVKRILSSVDPEDEVEGARLIYAFESRHPATLFYAAPEMWELLADVAQAYRDMGGHLGLLNDDNDCLQDNPCHECRVKALLAYIDKESEEK